MACLKTSGAVFLATLALSAALHDRPHQKHLRTPKPSELTEDVDAQDKPKKGKKHAVVEEKPAKIHDDAISGLHLSRAWYMNEKFGKATFTVANHTQCQGDRDSMGDTACHFHFGDTVNVKAGWNRGDVEKGTTIEINVELKPTGVMAVMQVDPIKIKCPACGGTCEFDIFRGNGEQLVPTEGDMVKIPIIGAGLIQAASAAGMPLPKTRKDLSQQINGILAMVAMIQPGLYDASAFVNEKQQFVFGDKTIKFPMPKCPLKELVIPAMTSPPIIPGLSISLDSESFGMNAVIPEMDVFDLAEGIANVGLKLLDKNGDRLTAFSGSFGMNALPKDMKLLEEDIAAKTKTNSSKTDAAPAM